MTKKRADLFHQGIISEGVAIRRVRWQRSHRLIPTRYPPIDLFERISDPKDWDALIELESLTNPRMRQELGEVSFVPKSRRVSGTGASIVMAPFTHVSKDRPTRFSDGTYGVYYAAKEFETALREVAFHMARFHAATSDPALSTAYREYVGKIDRVLHDITQGDWSSLLGPKTTDYAVAQKFAKALRENGSNGILYPSVRNKGGLCVAAFHPDVVKIPVQGRHIQLHWNGSRIDKWFNEADQTWSAL